MFKERTHSFVIEGKRKMAEKSTDKAMVCIIRGLQYYSGKILKALSPYSESDAGLVVISLRHIADQIEKNNPGTKEYVKEMSKCLVFPDIEEIQKVQKANRRTKYE
jgi:hypothetical protein